jgi:Flp pilus assembly pilin Flp
MGYMVALLETRRELIQALAEKFVGVDEAGQDMVEYALLVALITIPLLLTIMAIGPYLQNTFQDVANTLATAH